MIEHLIWDFDGTLYDSYRSITRSMLYALSDMGQMAQPAELMKELKVSVFYTATVEAQKRSLNIDELMKQFQKYHLQDTSFQPYAGAKSCLHTLRQMGCKHYLYTHRNQSAVDLLRRDGLAEEFRGFLTRDSGFPDKPAPDAILNMIDQYEMDKSAAVMIGDRDIDLLAGRAAGVGEILFDPDHFYDEFETPLRAHSMGELEKLVRGQLK